MVLFISRSNLIMTHTLTAFMQLMDHGIVSWENLSSIFIKKVSTPQPSPAKPLWTPTLHHSFSLNAPFLSLLPSLPRSPTLSMPSTPMPPFSRCHWTSWRAWCRAATASSCRSNRKSPWRGWSLTCKCKWRLRGGRVLFFLLWRNRLSVGQKRSSYSMDQMGKNAPESKLSLIPFVKKRVPCKPDCN